MNYIQAIQSRLRELATNDLSAGQVRVYSLLVLTNGSRTTAHNVHDAWAVDRNEDRSEHPDLIPFDQLTPETIAWDLPFVELIHKVAAEFPAVAP